MSRPTFIRQPGPEAPDRIVSVAATGRSFTFTLEPGILLLEAVRRGFAANGFESGVVELGAVALAPLVYVMPALSRSPANAAYYSDVFRPPGVCRLTGGALSFGARDDKPYFHCHALWRGEGGAVSGGHILPEETRVAEPSQVTALGFSTAAFTAAPDAEINFTVFGPIVTLCETPGAATGVIALRLRPNQDLHAAIEAACLAHGVSRARIRGGVGSIIGARFDDGREVRNAITEAFITRGHISADEQGRPAADMSVGLIDHAGLPAEGRLQRGENPVLMTFELALEIE